MVSEKETRKRVFSGFVLHDDNTLQSLELASSPYSITYRATPEMRGMCVEQIEGLNIGYDNKLDD